MFTPRIAATMSRFGGNDISAGSCSANDSGAQIAGMFLFIPESQQVHLKSRLDYVLLCPSEGFPGLLVRGAIYSNMYVWWPDEEDIG